jgi:hypothetical protein
MPWYAGARKIALAALSLVMLLCFCAVSWAATSPSNKWRLQFSGGAHSDGVIVILITPKNGQATTAEIAIKKGTGENAVAKKVTRDLKVLLPKDYFHVERDDGEDVLIKKRRKGQNFAVDIVSNSVKGVRINPDRE